MVRKYLWLWIEGTAKGPQISKCKSSNLLDATDELRGKGNCFCLEKWQMSQVAFESKDKDGYTWGICANLL